MTAPDLINACFEFFGGFAVWRHVRRLKIDKRVRGADIWATVFFTSWVIGTWYTTHTLPNGLASWPASTLRRPTLTGCILCGGTDARRIK